MKKRLNILGELWNKEGCFYQEERLCKIWVYFWKMWPHLLNGTAKRITFWN